MTPAKTILAFCLLGVFTSAAHAELKCGPKDTKETQAGTVMCCYSETKTETCGDRAKTAKTGDTIDCGKTTKKTEKTCVDIKTRTKQLEDEAKKKK
jgi:hypothetical protein